VAGSDARVADTRDVLVQLRYREVLYVLNLLIEA
jgi:hypothetical protein